MLVVMRKEGESILIYPNDIPEGMTVAELFLTGL
jgi:sRNA-binding carbon storage regulator CsrA